MNAIETQALTKTIGTVEAVRGLNLRVSDGQITGFLGRNGAGKSTTIKMLLGMVRPSSGSGNVLGRRIDDPSQSLEMRRHVAYVAEDKQLYPYFTVQEMVRFTRSFYDDWDVNRERLLMDLYELPPKRKVKALSKGMRTKLALLLALARNAKLMILDEPTEGLDPVAIEEMLQSLVAASSRGTTVFFSSHQIAEVERIADRICIIDHGTLVRDVAMESLRDQYRRVTLGFASDPSPADFVMDGVGTLEVHGRQLSFCTTSNLEQVLERARQLEATSVQVDPLGLRDVFLESVKAES